jgi:hypothetical protein
MVSVLGTRNTIHYASTDLRITALDLQKSAEFKPNTPAAPWRFWKNAPAVPWRFWKSLESYFASLLRGF